MGGSKTPFINFVSVPSALSCARLLSFTRLRLFRFIYKAARNLEKCFDFASPYYDHMICYFHCIRGDSAAFAYFMDISGYGKSAGSLIREFLEQPSRDILVMFNMVLEKALRLSVRDYDFLPTRSPDGFIDNQFDGVCGKAFSNFNSGSFPVTLLLDNLRSAFNAGSILRSAECLGIKKIIFTGYTPLPDHPTVKKTSMGTWKRIIWERADDAAEVIVKFQKMFKENGGTTAALEKTENSESLFHTGFSGPLLIVAGNEKYGVSSKIIRLVDRVCHLPVYGWKNSLNVSNAVTSALYIIRSKCYSDKSDT